MKKLWEKIKAWAGWAKLAAWWTPKWAKLKPGVLALGGLLLGILALIGLGRGRKAPDGQSKPADGGTPADSPQAQEAADAAKEKTRNETLNRDPSDIVDGLDDRARGGIDAAKQAGRDAAREALHGSGGAGRG